jgi:hypothetical protein
MRAPHGQLITTTRSTVLSAPVHHHQHHQHNQPLKRRCATSAAPTAPSSTTDGVDLDYHSIVRNVLRVGALQADDGGTPGTPGSPQEPTQNKAPLKFVPERRSSSTTAAATATLQLLDNGGVAQGLLPAARLLCHGGLSLAIQDIIDAETRAPMTSAMGIALRRSVFGPDVGYAVGSDPGAGVGAGGGTPGEAGNAPGGGGGGGHLKGHPMDGLGPTDAVVEIMQKVSERSHT